MFVRLLKHWSGRKPGTVLDMPNGAANALLRQPGRFAELVIPLPAAEPKPKAKQAHKK